MLHSIRCALLFALTLIAGIGPAAATTTLRDAIYLYNQDLYAGGQTLIVGRRCDVFQLVLDVESGYADLTTNQYDNGSLDSNPIAYPDRIQSTASMFSYMLYADKHFKYFEFNDRNNSSGTGKIGTGTVFGYCLSDDPDAYVYLYDEANCRFQYSNGSTAPISPCTPLAQSPSGGTAPTSDMSDLVGSYVQNVSQTVSGSSCSAYEVTSGTGSVNYNVTRNGTALTVIARTEGDGCTFDLVKTSGDSTAGYNLSGTGTCVSGLSGGTTVSSLKKVGTSLTGSMRFAASGCTVNLRLQ